MAIYRGKRPQNGFTIIRNGALRDTRLSYRARGILAAILSHDEGWSTTSEDLTREGQEGRDAVRTALAELEQAGYMRRERRQDDRGRWSTQVFVYDEPQPSAVQEALIPPMTDFQASVVQSSVDQALRTEDHPEDSVPSERASSPEAEIARAVYDHAQGMVKFLPVQQIAGRALKTGATPAQVIAAMNAVTDRGATITLATVRAALNGSTGQNRVVPVDDWTGESKW